MSKQILLILPSVLLSRGLAQTLAASGEFEAACILSDLSGSAPSLLHGLHFDAVLADPSLFGRQAMAGGKMLIAELTGDIPVVAVECSVLDESVRKHYDGVISLYDTPASVIKTLRDALSGRVENRTGGSELSAREKEILVCVAQGMLSKEIADRLHLSIHTVITHRKNITRKTGIKTVAGLTVYAMMNGLMDA